MYSNTSGYVHMGLRLDWGKGGGSNTTHALLSPDPETLPMGEVSCPATGEFLGTKRIQGQPTVAPHAFL